VPEDWECADAGKLVRLSMQTSGKSAFDPKPEDLNFFFSPGSLKTAQQGVLHA
jgi:flagellar biosynthesis protein FlhF